MSSLRPGATLGRCRPRGRGTARRAAAMRRPGSSACIIPKNTICRRCLIQSSFARLRHSRHFRHRRAGQAGLAWLRAPFGPLTPRNCSKWCRPKGAAFPSAARLQAPPASPAPTTTPRPSWLRQRASRHARFGLCAPASSSLSGQREELAGFALFFRLSLFSRLLWSLLTAKGAPINAHASGALESGAVATEFCRSAPNARRKSPGRRRSRRHVRAAKPHRGKPLSRCCAAESTVPPQAASGC